MKAIPCHMTRIDTFEILRTMSFCVYKPTRSNIWISSEVSAFKYLGSSLCCYVLKQECVSFNSIMSAKHILELGNFWNDNL
jgi:hypothetical protein